MEATEIIEGNKLIAEFMGSPVTKYKEDDYIYTSRTGQKEYASYDCELAVINNAVYEATELKYHLLFDWLMPVYIKFRELPYKSDKHTAHMNLITQALIHGRIDWLWNELTIAIKWYNETQKQ